MNKLIKQQLERVCRADLSNFNPETNEYLIKRRYDIKLEENGFYLLQIKDTFKNNETIKINWNAGSIPPFNCYKVNVIKVMGKMFKVNGVAYDLEKNQDINSVWSGWLTLNDTQILKKI